MRVVGLQELGELPLGSILWEYEPCIVGDLFRLGEVIRWEGKEAEGGFVTGYAKDQVIDFFYLDLKPDPHEALKGRDDLDNPQKLELGTRWGRWGCFEMDAKFILMEAADIKRLCGLLTASHEDIIKEHP